MSQSPKEESLIQWFDRNVEKELKKRRTENAGTSGFPLDSTLTTLKTPIKMGREMGERLAETSASHIEIASKLKGPVDTRLADAVDKLAAAEAIRDFSKALEAAEKAAQEAPPDMVEEYALAGARDFQTEVTGTVKGVVPGDKPIEVIGYVGVTRPKYPKK